MPYDAFISYASGDKAVADRVCSMLESHRLRCWIAPRNILPGQEYGEAIVDAIADSKALVLVFSSKSNASPQVEREIERAASKQVNIIPFRIEDVKPSKRLEYFISSCQWCDAFSGKLEPQVQALAAVIQGQAPPPPPVVVKGSRSRLVYAAVAGTAIAMLLAASLYLLRAPADERDAPGASTADGIKGGTEQAGSKPPPPVAPIQGDWKAHVTYDWGDQYVETFKFKVDGDEVLGTASFLGTARGILEGKLSGDKLVFVTKTQEVAGSDSKDVIHRYRATVSDDQLKFYMQTEGGFSTHTPIEFVGQTARVFDSVVPTPVIDRGRPLDCGKSDPEAFRVVKEFGRVAAQDYLNHTLYAFAICEERDTANDTFRVKVIGSWLTGTVLDGEQAVELAREMETKQTRCQARGAPYGQMGKNDHRQIVYNFCQKDGQPDSMEVRVTTLKADARPNPEQVLSVEWPRY